MDINKIKVIVVGATGLVGREMLKILSEINFPIENVSGAASAYSECCRINYGENHEVVVQDLGKVNFKDYDVALFSAGSDISEKYVPKAIDAGCYVIDNTSFFRMRSDVPLVIPEINIDAVGSSKLIANPNCSTIQAVLPLKPLHDLFKLKDVVFSTYQSASGAGKDGIRELEEQFNAFNEKKHIECNIFQHQLAYNVIPIIGSTDVSNYTVEELKMINETKKILSLPDISVTATCVRVPVIVSHAVSVTAYFKYTVNMYEALLALSKHPGISFSDKHITPIDVVGKNDVFVTRLRQVPEPGNGITFWCVADNLRKGAALNAVQILQKLCE